MANRKSTTSFVPGDWVVWRETDAARYGPYQVTEVMDEQVVAVAGIYPDVRLDRKIVVKKNELRRINSVSGLSFWLPLKNHRAWQHGVVLASNEDTWQVLLDSKTDEVLSIPFRNHLLNERKKNLWIKEFRSIPNPFNMLRLGMSTQVEEIQVARDFRTWVYQQSDASMGFSAVLSSPIRPAHHQLNAVARVLGDPTLRFLLADEVGLGKTIEAGLILKQLFLDGSIKDAVIVVPRMLKLQWRRELKSRLSLGRLIEANQIQIISHEDLESNLSTDLLIVDEVHRFCRGEKHEASFSDLQIISQRVKRLLLISATPMRNEPYMLLQLMNLLDPKNYRLSDEQNFEQRLAMRVRQSKALRLLKPQATQEQRAYFVKLLRESTPSDFTINVLLATIENAETSDSKLSSAIDSLRSIIEERYRISRRLIRNRRSSIDELDFPLSGRKCNLIKVTEGNATVLNEFVEVWRERCLDANWVSVEQVFTSLLEHALAGESGIRKWIQQRLEDVKQGIESPMFDTERSLLEQYLVLLPKKNRIADLLCEYLAPMLTTPISQPMKSGKTVLCTGHTDQASTLLETLSEKFGSCVVGHLETKSDKENDEAIRIFSENDDCCLLVIDSSAEEGLNLQIARRIINIDLPWSVNRLEQRLGRLDRYSDGVAVDATCEVVIDEENVVQNVFLRFISDSTGVFEQSVATAQRALALTMRELAFAFWESGLRDVRFDTARARVRVEEEKEEVEELESIESGSSFGDFPENNFRRLLSLEEDESQSAFIQLIGSYGGLGIVRQSLVNNLDICKYVFSRGSRVPSTLQDRDRIHLSARGTLSREVAIRFPDTELLRIGNRMIDYLEDYLERDDVGRVTVGWVQDLQMERPYIDFSIEILVYPDLDFLKDLIPTSDLTRVCRRIGTSLRPQLLELRVDEHGSLLDTDEPVWKTGTQSIIGEDLIKVIDTKGSFGSKIDEIEPKLGEFVQAIMAKRIEVALSETSKDSDRRIQALKIWEGGDLAEEIETEELIVEELDYGLRHLKFNVLSLIAVVHSFEEFN
jgi:ATP-dependent helicase HepA